MTKRHDGHCIFFPIGWCELWGFADRTDYDFKSKFKRLALIGEYNKKHGDARKVLGVVAGGVVADNVLTYVQGKGLYVIVHSGKSVDLAKLPENFVPKSW